ncbi:MAG TPA: NADH-quinone oxidoreductase subunit M [Puia sp.]|nr:NADH-quinone oxidoreductase subunit M [Puia sp.]
MIPVLLIVIPLVCGLAGYFIKNENGARTWSLFSSIITLAVSLTGLCCVKGSAWLHTDVEWLPRLGSRFSVGLDGMGQILCLLTALSFPIIFISTWRADYGRNGQKKARNFYALMLLSQAGLMGVFVAFDALLFYFFWELALIPVYFLCSQWGGEKRIQATFKFFIYTFMGSLLMLVGIIWLYSHTPDHSFSLDSFYKLRTRISSDDQMWLFWLFFIAFGIKMPIWPLHTWQPDTYEQAPTAVTMVLSGVMVKMGLFGVIRWLAPVLPVSTYAWGDTASALCIIGMIYASLIAIQQDDLKRLLAYSSIAHIGLMCLAIFATTTVGMQGAMIQMFNHGINIIGMWIVVELIERQFHTRKISELGGLAQKAPSLAILLVIVALANVALPLTNAFIGEFLLFSGVYGSAVTKYNVVFTATAGLSIILSAVYTLNMIQKVFFGNTNKLTEKAKDIRLNEKLILALIVVLIVIIGIYPKPVLDLTKDTVETIITKMNYKQ